MSDAAWFRCSLSVTLEMGIVGNINVKVSTCLTLRVLGDVYLHASIVLHG